jgi:hypothetical protein
MRRKLYALGIGGQGAGQCFADDAIDSGGGLESERGMAEKAACCC